MFRSLLRDIQFAATSYTMYPLLCNLHFTLIYLFIHFNSEGSRCQYAFCTACQLAFEGYQIFHYTLNAPILNIEDFVSLSCVEKVICGYMGMLSVECMLVLHMQCLVYLQSWFQIFICQYSWN
jgi:hypothetical protein